MRVTGGRFFPHASILLAALLLAGPAVAIPDCLPYETFFHWIVRVPNSAGALDVAVQGEYAYVTGYWTAVMVFNISDPYHPGRIQDIDISEYAGKILCKPPYLFVSGLSRDETTSHLHVIDVSDPLSPLVLGQATLPAEPSALAYDPPYLYVCAGSLCVIDVRDPARPTVVANLALASPPMAVAVSKGRAYLAMWDRGLNIVDVSDPLHPTFQQEIDLPHRERAITVAGDYAFLGSFRTLLVLDISGPTPVRVGEVTVGNPEDDFIGDIVVRDHFLFLSSNYGGVKAVDVSDPTAPFVVGEIGTGDRSLGIADAGNCVLVADCLAGLQVMAAMNPQTAGASPAGGITEAIHDIAVAGNILFAANSDSGLVVADISLPENPAPLALVATPGSVRSMRLDSDRLYLACQRTYGATPTGRLQIVDIANPENAAPLGDVPLPGWMLAVEVAGQYAYVAAGDRGLQVVDVSDPRAPVLVTSLATPRYAMDVAVKENRAYIAGFDGGFQVVDITDPRVPAYLGSSPTFGNAFAIELVGDRAYVGGGSGGMRIFDIAGAGIPEALADVTLPGPLMGEFAGHPRDLVANGNYVYVACEAAGIQVVDITSPTSPLIAGLITVPSYAVAIAVTNDGIWIAGASSGLLLAPRQCGDALAVSIRDFGAGWSDGLAVVHWLVEEGPGIASLALYREGPSGHRMLVREVPLTGQELYQIIDTAANSTGHERYWLRESGAQGSDIWHGPVELTPQEAPSILTLGPACPNPFNPSTSIRLTLPRAGRIAVSIYDQRGRLVKRLTQGEMPAGVHPLAWDGEDSRGAPAASGTYVARLVTRQGVCSAKLMLTR